MTRKLSDVAYASMRLELNRTLDGAHEQIQMSLEDLRHVPRTDIRLRSARSSLVRALQDTTMAMALLEVINQTSQGDHDG